MTLNVLARLTEWCLEQMSLVSKARRHREKRPILAVAENLSFETKLEARERLKDEVFLCLVVA